jgi:hypothetical protein
MLNIDEETNCEKGLTFYTKDCRKGLGEVWGKPISEADLGLDQAYSSIYIKEVARL